MSNNNDNSFYSMDKLVEFGMGISVAKQMAKSMNEIMEESRLPDNNLVISQTPYAQGCSASAVPQELFFYIVLDGKQAGPFSESEVGRLCNEKKITKDTLVWTQHMTEWKKAEDVPQVLRLIALCPPPVPEGV